LQQELLTLGSERKSTLLRFLATLLAAAGLSGPAPAQRVSENMELMGAIAREIVNCRELDGVDWVEVSAIFAMNDKGSVNESYGYAYDRSGRPHAVAFLYDPIERAVEHYHEWLRQKADKGMIKMLFQFNRETQKVNADFEYDNPDRWQVTPDNIDTIVEELRPKLGK
jgi:hypothetical protein